MAFVKYKENLNIRPYIDKYDELAYDVIKFIKRTAMALLEVILRQCFFCISQLGDAAGV